MYLTGINGLGKLGRAEEAMELVLGEVTIISPLQCWSPRQVPFESAYIERYHST